MQFRNKGCRAAPKGRGPFSFATDRSSHVTPRKHVARYQATCVLTVDPVAARPPEVRRARAPTKGETMASKKTTQTTAKKTPEQEAEEQTITVMAAQPPHVVYEYLRANPGRARVVGLRRYQVDRRALAFQAAWDLARLAPYVNGDLDPAARERFCDIVYALD